MSADEILETFAVDGPGCDGCGDTTVRKRPLTVVIAGERCRRYYCGDCDPLAEPGAEAVLRDPWSDRS